LWLVKAKFLLTSNIFRCMLAPHTGEPVDFSQYQEGVFRTWRPTPVQVTPEQEAILHAALGLCGEAGEIVEHIKKRIFMGREEFMRPEDMKKELGDAAYYVTALAGLFGFTLEEICEANNRKLAARWPNGFVDKTGGNRTGEGA
jgi:NTP pyrophosphatase (non-canonical NTP hydrolase)